jgi:plasmid maintenance system antidote protein VapI
MPDLWLGMQSKYDLWRAAKGRRLKIEPLRQTAA